MNVALVGQENLIVECVCKVMDRLQASVINSHEWGKATLTPHINSSSDRQENSCCCKAMQTEL